MFFFRANAVIFHCKKTEDVWAAEIAGGGHCIGSVTDRQLSKRSVWYLVKVSVGDDVLLLFAKSFALKVGLQYFSTVLIDIVCTLKGNVSQEV